MPNLNSFIEKQLNTKSMSNTNLIRFAKAHIAFLKADNPGNIYSAMIKDTEASYKAFLDALALLSDNESNVDDILKSKQKIEEKRKMLEMDMMYNAIMITQENMGDLGETKKYFPVSI
jgi:hypothetical protein